MISVWYFLIIGVINRAQLVSDALNLARAGALNYSMALEVTQYLTQELDYLPWKAAFNGFTHLNSMLSKTGGYDKFKVKYILPWIFVIYPQNKNSISYLYQNINICLYFL